MKSVENFNTLPEVNFPTDAKRKNIYHFHLKSLDVSISRGLLKQKQELFTHSLLIVAASSFQMVVTRVYIWEFY